MFRSRRDAAVTYWHPKRPPPARFPTAARQYQTSGIAVPPSSCWFPFRCRHRYCPRSVWCRPR